MSSLYPSPLMSSAQSNIAQDERHPLVQAYERFPCLSYLNPDEIRAASRHARQLHPNVELQFVEVTPLDVSKQYLISTVQQNDEFTREIEVVSQYLARNETYVDVISMTAKLHCETVHSRTLTDVQPSVLHTEYRFVNDICRTYEPLRQTLLSHGMNPDFVVADSWCSPEYMPSERICWASLYYFDTSVDCLPYARPIDGISIRISLTKREVVHYDDSLFEEFPVPTTDDSKSKFYPTNRLRQDLRPIVITQPEGPSFNVENDTHVLWQKWSMQVGFTGREGLVLTGICYEGRPIMHRLSMVEMVVPYGDTRAPQTWKNAFDAGEDGLGYNANSLVLGCDCLGLIHYFDGHIVDETGEPYTITRAICMHEEDASIGWKHTDWRTGTPHVTRSRRLVLSFICTIANYEYGFYFHFYLNGNIEVDVKLTGVLNTGAMSKTDLALQAAGGGGRKYGTQLSKHLYASVHQHFFVARMDFAIDGVDNSVYEWNVKTEADDDEENNAQHNGFYYEQKQLSCEAEAKRQPCADTARFWQVGNPNVQNAIGSMVSYRFHPQSTIRPYANLDRSVFLKRAKFLQHQLWVTPWQQRERYPGGDFPNQSQEVQGLPVWTQANRSLDDTDVVVWHVFGVTHLPRPEEWPIMPAEHCGFKLTPFGFFDHSPAMDVPSDRHISQYTAASAGQHTVTDDSQKHSCCAKKQQAAAVVAAAAAHVHVNEIMMSDADALALLPASSSSSSTASSMSSTSTSSNSSSGSVSPALDFPPLSSAALLSLSSEQNLMAAVANAAAHANVSLLDTTAAHNLHHHRHSGTHSDSSSDNSTSDNESDSNYSAYSSLMQQSHYSHGTQTQTYAVTQKHHQKHKHHHHQHHHQHNTQYQQPQPQLQPQQYAQQLQMRVERGPRSDSEVTEDMFLLFPVPPPVSSPVKSLKASSTANVPVHTAAAAAAEQKTHCCHSANHNNNNNNTANSNGNNGSNTVYSVSVPLSSAASLTDA